jgi:uncharacterized membrane protein
MKNAPETPPPLEWKDYYTVMAHFYRGELGRIMVWRQRLDITTNWAIVASTGIITFVLGHEEATHLLFLFVFILVFLLLIIESRRYRYYDAFRARVRMLEAHVLAPVSMRKTDILQGDWNRVLSEDLIIPSFKISRGTAILRRFRRNYIWIFLILFCAWMFKIWSIATPNHSAAGLLAAIAKDQPLPLPALVAVLLLFFLAFVSVTILSVFSPAAAGEFGTRPMRGTKWSL